MNLAAAFEEWRAQLGVGSVLDAAGAQLKYGSDTSGAVRRIAGALLITDRRQIPAAVRSAARCKVPLYPISTGHNWGYGSALPARDDCVILDLSALTAILDFDPELGVVTVEPGVTQAMLSGFLEAGAHPFLVPVTGAGPHCSLLGNALERGYGVTPQTDHFGAVTDLEAVLADGSIYRTMLCELGGEQLARLFKWGVGPYSAGLFTQSGFGIVTQASILLARRPPSVKAFLFNLEDEQLLAPALGRIQEILSLLPGTVGAINLMNRRRVLAMSAPYPWGQLGPDGLIPEARLTQMGRQYQIFPWTGFGTLYGSRRVVAAAQRDIREALRGVASRLIFITQAQAEKLATVARFLPGKMGQNLRRSTRMLANALSLAEGRPNETALRLSYWKQQGQSNTPLNPARDGCGLIWYAPLVPAQGGLARQYVDMVTRIAGAHGIEPLITFTSLSERVFDSTVPLLFDKTDPASVARAQDCYRALLAEGRALGCFPYRLGISAMAESSAEAACSGAFHRRLREAIDPNGIISPGRYAK